MHPYDGILMSQTLTSGGSITPMRAALLIAFLGTSVAAGDVAAQGGVTDAFARTEPAVGRVAPDFTLPRLDGGSFTLLDALADGPVLIRLATPT